MYLYTFLYPRPKSRTFDFEYHRHVHMPMGIGLAKRHLGIQPLRFWIERIDEDDPASTQKYCAIVHLLFEKREDRDRLAEMARIPEAAQRLGADYDNYTDTRPEVRLARVTIDEDMPALIDQFNRESDR